MYSISSAFRAAINSSHQPISRATLWTRGQYVRDLPVIGGSVTVDENSSIRRRCTLTLADPLSDLVPESVTDPLWPKFNEVKVESGLRFRDQSTEYIPLGVFRVSNPKVTDKVADFGLSIDCYDRSRSISRSSLTTTYTIAEGTNYASAIKELIQFVMPFLEDAQFNFMLTSRVTPQLILKSGADPWKEAQNMALSLGAELFFDPAGLVVLRAIPDPSFSPVVWEYTGQEATFLEAERSLNDEKAYNTWIAIGESSDLDPPFRVEQVDDVPSSPTYYDPLDPWAVKVPYFVSSGYITSEAQATEAITAARLRDSGFTENVTISAINNPAHEAGDVVRIDRGRSKIQGLYVFSSLSFSLSPGSPMSVTTRRRLV